MKFEHYAPVSENMYVLTWSLVVVCLSSTLEGLL